MGDGVEPASFGWLDAAGIQATGNRTLFEPVSGDGWPETGKRYVVLVGERVTDSQGNPMGAKLSGPVYVR